MSERGTRERSKNEKVAIFVALSVVTMAFVIPAFSFFEGITVSEGSSIFNADLSGELIIRDIKAGDGRDAMNGDTLILHYRGTLLDGTVFASSFTGEPYSFVLGAHKVISGWEKGLVGMKEGGVRMLVVPPALGYKDKAIGPIPANSTLIFEIELLQVIPAKIEQ